jgi:CRP-like cAMP-binding protein
MVTHTHSARDEANRLLLALPDAAYARVEAHLEVIALPFKLVLFEADARIENVYFPQSGCLSMITIMGDGDAVEVGTVGLEGMVGVSFLHGVDSVPTQCIVQVAGVGKRMPRAAFLDEIRENTDLADVMHRYAQVWVNQVGRSASCNAAHTVEQRCARWLLMTHDRVLADMLPLTQEFLAVMLGVHRPSVTLAAGALADAGLIHYTRGRITVLDRSGLEAAACECYGAMQSSYDRLLSS